MKAVHTTPLPEIGDIEYRLMPLPVTECKGLVFALAQEVDSCKGIYNRPLAYYDTLTWADVRQNLEALPIDQQKEINGSFHSDLKWRDTLNNADPVLDRLGAAALAQIERGETTDCP